MSNALLARRSFWILKLRFALLLRLENSTHPVAGGGFIGLFASFAGSVHQLACQVGVLLGPGLCLFFQVGASGMAAFDYFVIVEGLVKLFHFSGEFSRVHGAYPVVLRGGEDERFGVVAIGLELVVWGDIGEELALFGDG